jgi:hypothetical protein
MAVHDRAQLVPREHDGGHLHPEALGDRGLDARGVLGRRGLLTCHHGVAAVQHGLHVGVAEVAEQRAQVGHGHPIELPEVDPAQQHGVPGHGAQHTAPKLGRVR